MLSIDNPCVDDVRQETFIAAFERRVRTIPPGTCPILTQVTLLQASAVQTCGKCVPCRDGIPYLISLLSDIAACQATPEQLQEARALATSVRDTSDCAIGYAAGDFVLQGMETFAAEYESHITAHICTPGVAQTVPCETMCPAHVDVPAYIGHTLNGDVDLAIKTVRKDNPYVTACALVCEHPCESRCRRAIIDAPLNIRGIKKYAVDTMSADTVGVPAPLPASGRSIAVVGGGPSGMTCAYYLALMGHKVTVYEARKQLGGMMRYGIPAYRFPRERLDQDNAAILRAGDITVEYETPIDARRMRDLAASNDAVYVAIGAQAGKTLNLEGLDTEGVMSAVDMLSAIGDGSYPDFSGKKVAVIGGGNVAMDCARTAVRAGAESVTVAYRRRLEDMTALPAEIESAIAEGIEMMTLQAPVRVETDETGACARLVVQPQYISAVKRGRPAPANADKPEVTIAADVVLVAVGQDIVSDDFREFGMETERGSFVADEHLRAQGTKGVFVGGDCQTGPATVIRAIAAGKVAARNIDRYLGFNHTLDADVKAPLPAPNDRTAYGRVQISERPARIRKHDFEYVEEPMSAEEALQECGRCLRCDCNGCGTLEGGRVRYV